MFVRSTFFSPFPPESASHMSGAILPRVSLSFDAPRSCCGECCTYRHCSHRFLERLQKSRHLSRTGKMSKRKEKNIFEKPLKKSVKRNFFLSSSRKCANVRLAVCCPCAGVARCSVSRTVADNSAYHQRPCTPDAPRGRSAHQLGTLTLPVV